MKVSGLTIEKAVLTAVLASWYAFAPQTGYGNHGDLSPVHHALYMLSHAGVWHLAGNLFVVWIMRRRLYLAAAAVIAFAASYLPVISPLWPLDGVTMGFSGVIFAIWGVKWGVYCQSFVPLGYRAYYERVCEFCVKILPFAMAGAVIPHVNWCLHLYCLLIGFGYGRWGWKRYGS